MIPFAYLQKTSLIDYPNHISSIIFVNGCNFRCSYCYNSSIVLNNNRKIKENEILDFLKSRINKIEAVTITGGEPTLYEDLPEFIKKIKNMNFKVKLDTNGTNPNMIQNLLKENLLDYIAMDIKTSFEKYHLITQTKFNENIKKSIEIIKNSNINHEFRTTLIKPHVTKEDIINISNIINPSNYFLQKFEINEYLINKQGLKEYKKEEIKEILKSINNKNIKLRGYL